MLNIKRTKRIVMAVVAISAVILPSTIFAVNKINSTETTFAATMPSGFNDQNFYDCVLADFQDEYPSDVVPSSGLTDAQLAKIKTLYCAGDDKAESEKITDATGVEKLVGLNSLIIRSHKLSNINLRPLSGLTVLDVDDNELSGTLDISNNTNLETLWVHNNKLSRINFGSVVGLKNLNISYNEFSGVLDLNANAGLITLHLDNNSISELKFNSMADLKILSIARNEISGVLDVSRNSNLETLDANGNKLTGVRLGTITSLKSIYLNNNQIEGMIDISNNTNLSVVFLDGNKLTGVKLDNTGAIVRLELSDNLLSGTLDMQNRTNLSILGVYNNNLTELLVSNSPNLKNLYADNIVVTAGVEKTSEASGRKQFNLSGLKFISEDGNTTINNTSNYTFDAAGKLLDVNDVAYTKGYVTTSPIDTSKRLSSYKTYKLRIGEINDEEPDAPNSEGEDSDGDNQDTSDGKDQNPEDVDNLEDVVVPNTSGGTELGGKMDTGAFTNEGDGSSPAGFSALPIAIVLLAAICITGRKYMARKKFNW